jgi:hypothetical protein
VGADDSRNVSKGRVRFTTIDDFRAVVKLLIDLSRKTIAGASQGKPRSECIGHGFSTVAPEAPTAPWRMHLLLT